MARPFLSTLFAAALLCTTCCVSPARADDEDQQVQHGEISSHTTADGARLVFKWNSQSKVAFTPQAKGNKIFMRFASPVDLKWENALDDLSPYLKEVETRDDNKTVVLTMSCPAQVKKFLVNGKNGIDFSKNGLEISNVRRSGKPTPIITTRDEVDDDKAPVTPPPQKAKAKKAKKQAKLAAKKPVAMQTASNDADLAKLSPAAGKAEVPIVLPPVAPSVTVAQPTSPDSVSLTAEGLRLAQLSPAAGETTTAPPVAVTPAAIAPTEAIPAPAAIAPAKAATVLVPAQSVSAPAVSNAAPAPAPIPVAPQAAAEPTPTAPVTAAVEPTAAAPITSTVRLSDPVAPVTAAVPPAGTTPAPAAPETAPATATAPAAPAAKVATVALPLLSDDPIAVFTKNKTLWIAADESAKLSEQSFRAENKTLPYPIQTLPTTNGTVIAIGLDKPLNAEVVKRADNKLELELKVAPGTLVQSLHAQLSTQDAKTSLSIEAPKSGKIISATDPSTGEALSIIPLPTFGSGVDAKRSFVEFSLLPTAQGIVVLQKADDVRVDRTKDSIEIGAQKGLAVSPEIKQQFEDANAGADKAPPVFFPYARWKLDDEKKFVPTQLKLIHASLSDNAEDANNARLRLLGLFLAEGLFSEANGMANEILRNSYKFYVAHNVAAMRGAANFFRYRLADAKRDFSSPELADSPETRMWLELCNELTEQKDAQFKFKENYDSIIKYYPPVFIQKMAVIAADKSITRKEYDAATAIFGILEKEGNDEPVKKYVDFMRAKILSETGNEDEAAKIWERQTGDVNDRLIRARAEFSLVNMYLKEEKIPIEDATKRLEKLRIVWRGDGLELNILSLLGSLYVEQKDYAHALRAWRDIVAYYPEVPDAVATARKMEDVFVRLFNKGGADAMPPLSALSLFYEFRDLVPAGSDGDLMIRNLAERLVKIDLLDRASQLLSHQVRNRLQGTERSRVGARLAEIYLMNRQPKEALEILKTTGYGDLSAELQLQRIRLTAQALAQQGQLDKAIDVLSSDTSAEGNLLRLTVYWTNWDWPNVVSTAEEILSNRNDPSASLTLQESEVLLKLATAYVYEHDSGQIQYLRDYFTPLLKNNPNKSSFLFITSESGSIDYGNLSNLDKDISTVRSFIDNSRTEAQNKAAPVAAASPDIKKTVN